MTLGDVMNGGTYHTTRRDGGEGCGVAEGEQESWRAGYKLLGEQAAGREVRAMPGEE